MGTTYKEKFFNEFGTFLKEGICQDFENKDKIAKLLYYESSALDGGETTSFTEYISRCDPAQKDIYYLSAPSRELALASPYYEIFKKHKREVLFVYHAIDDFVMSNIQNFNGRQFKNAESSNADLLKEISEDEKEREEKEGDSEDESSSGKKF